jgi:hypothetical protein
MPLQAADKAKLALWLCAARTLDDDCCTTDDPRGLSLVAAARSFIEGAAGGADLEVSEASQIGPYLEKAVKHLDGLPRQGINETAASMVSSASNLLRLIITGLQIEDNGDGPAISKVGSAPCSCGLLGFAAEIEHRIRELHATEAALPYEKGPELTYNTTLAEPAASQDFEPFCVDAKASIRQSPRMVTILLRKQHLKGRDLWHIAYALHHELICHAFQGASANETLSDAPASCHWSEGWMDAVAFELVDGWTNQSRPWLPVSGESAKGAVRELHEHRYVQPKSMSRDDVMRRRQARDAYKKLSEILKHYEIVSSENEAREVARRFSLMANSHPLANWRRLKSLGTNLRLLLTNTIRSEAAIAAAQACLAFTVHGRLEELEVAIRQA